MTLVTNNYDLKPEELELIEKIRDLKPYEKITIGFDHTKARIYFEVVSKVRISYKK